MGKRRYLASSDVARICQVTTVTVGNWIRSGKLTASRVPGGNYRVSNEDLVRFLQQANMHVPPGLMRTQSRVLIIEHDQAVVSRITNILTDTGGHWDIEVAYDCFTAGAKVIESEPDLVILSLLMPGIDPATCQQIQQTPAWSHAKVLAITATDKPASLAKAKSIGADCYLTKTFTAEELRSAVFNLLFGKIPPSTNRPVGPKKKDK